MESANKSVQNKLSAMMHDSGHADWYNPFDAVQHSKNYQVHSATKKQPYALVSDGQPRPSVFPGLPTVQMILDEDEVQEFVVPSGSR